LFQCIIQEILVGHFSLTLLEAAALDVPLIAGCLTCLIERRGKLVDSSMEDKSVVSSADPIFVGIQVSDE
jgi:hypothetical protein